MKKPLVESSIGIKTTEATARKIDTYLSNLPKTKAFEFRRKGVVAETNIAEMERTDTSLVTTRVVDRDNEIVDPDGFILDDFRANPIVLYGHDQNRPVGKALWIKPDVNGLLAKTLYTARPDKYVGEWLSDFVFSMVCADVLRGKSVGFLPLDMRDPNDDERALNPSVQTVITKSLLLEYSVVSVPSNPAALVETIGKGIGLEHWKIKVLNKAKPVAKHTKKRVTYKPVDWEAALKQLRLDPEQIAEEAVKRIRERWEV